MALTALTRRYAFRAVHSLNTGSHRELLHGHEFAIEVTFNRPDWEGVDQLVQEHALSKLHESDLSLLVQHATGEVLVNWIHDRLTESSLGPDLLGVALQETRKNRFVSGRSVGHVL